MRRTHHLILALAFLFGSEAAVGWDVPERGLLTSRRFLTNDHGGSGATWAFCVAPNGDSFIGTDRLVLSTGTWRYTVLDKPQTREIRALAATADGTIWLGAFDELGYLQRDQTGEYLYTSLRDRFQEGENAPGFEPILAVQPVGAGAAVFIGRTGVHIWNGQTFTHWNNAAKSPLQPLRPVPDGLWYYEPGRGVFAPSTSGRRQVLPETDLPGPVVWLLAPGTDETVSPRADGWLLGTANAVFVRRSGTWNRLPGLSDAVAEARPTQAVALDRNNLAIATQLRGVFIAARDDRVLTHLDGEPTLTDSQTQALWCDPFGDLWAGTSVGWSRILSPSLISRLVTVDDQSVSNVRHLLDHQGILFAATGRGVGRVQPGAGLEGNARLVPMPALPGSIWTLASSGDHLFAGGVGGLWRWTDAAWVTVRRTSDEIVCSLVPAAERDRLYFSDGTTLTFARIQGATSGLAAIEDAVELGAPAVSLIEDASGDLWVSTSAGTLHVVRATLKGMQSIRVYRPGAGLPAEVRRITLARVGDRVVAYGEGDILALDRRSDSFGPIPEFQGLRAVAGADPFPDGSALWILARTAGRPGSTFNYLAEVSVTPAGAWRQEPRFAEVFGNTYRPTNVLARADRSAVWLGGSLNIARIGNQASESASSVPAPRLLSATAVIAQPRSSSPVVRDRRAPSEAESGSRTQRLPLTGPLEPLPTDTERVIFEFSHEPTVRGTHVMYETRLVGLEQDWSRTTGSTREFTGLAAGRYELQVRTLDRTGQIGATIAYAFTRQAAWHARWPAWLLYGGVVALFVAAGMRWRVRSLQRQNERLNRMVDERTRELALANSAKMEFLATISHEIRNPLNGVTGLVGLLADAPLAPRERELARSLAACARSLRRVFDEVLGFARLEEGRISVRPGNFSLSALLHEIAGVFAAEALQRGATLSVKVIEPLPPLQADEGKIRTVVSNFVSNALKYAPGSPVTIEASTETRADGRLDLTLQVSDCGPGIPPEEQELVFRKFVRGSTAELHREPGAGLGLATCQALARALGGNVGVESELGSGSTFYLHVPVDPAKPGAPLADEEIGVTANLPLPAEATKARAALVVEDQEYNQLVARSILERLGYRVDVAATGQEARACIAEGGPYALALVDWDVPGAKGDELTPEIRARPWGGSTLVLAVTAHDDETIRDRCLGSGMNGFLVKPLEEDVLLHTLGSLRGLKRGEHESGTREPAASAQELPDFRVFDYLGSGDARRARVAAEEYLQQLNDELTGLVQASVEGDLAALATRSHRLRAHAAIVHCHPLKKAAHRLQERVTRCDRAAIAAALIEVQIPAERLREHLHTFLETPAPVA